MSRPRRLRCVFAVLLGWALLAGAFAGGAAAQSVPGQGLVRAAAVAMPASAEAAVAAPAAAGQGLVRAVGPAGPGSDLAAAFAHADSPGPGPGPRGPPRRAPRRPAPPPARTGGVGRPSAGGAPCSHTMMR
ncbi:hypothetical protein ACFXA9_17755, partial [Streptomyces sp. NPDC059411]